MADTPSFSSFCEARVLIHPPGSAPIEVPLSDLGRFTPGAPIPAPPPLDPGAPSLPPDPGAGQELEGEVWTEVDRQTRTVSVGGVNIARIERVRMRRPDGRVVELVFRNN